MSNHHWGDEVRKFSHIMITLMIVLFAIVLVTMNRILGWEEWTIPLIIIGSLSCLVMHIIHFSTETVRFGVYAGVLMLLLFYFSTHINTIYDISPAVILVMVVFTMTGEKVLNFLGLFGGYFCMFYHLITAFSEKNIDMKTDPNSILRTVWAFVMVFMSWIVVNRLRNSWNSREKEYEKKIRIVSEENRRVNTFLTNISHEIRTPINVVNGLTSVMIKKEKDRSIKKDMLMVQNAGHRVAERVADILDFAEIDIGRLSVTNETYMIDSVINDVVTDVRMKEWGDLELIFDISPKIPSSLVGDVVKIKKILNHLISNAIRFTKEGGIYIGIYSINRPYGVNLCIRVEDTGVGMNEDEVAQIFDSFYQGTSEGQRKAGGLGLGLTIVRGMVREMKGFVNIESRPDGGTIVSVSIPQQVADSGNCLSLEHKEKICIVLCFGYEKIKVPRVRDFYTYMVHNISEGLGVPVFIAEDIADIERYTRIHDVSHVFVGEMEYLSAADYLENLGSELRVNLVVDDDFVLDRKSRVNILRKPFYCFQLLNLFEAGKGLRLGFREDDRQMITPGLLALVVDDEPMNLIVARGIFSNYGMFVTTALSGQEAIDLCKKTHFDIIFMDHMMPEMDGVEAMKRIRVVYEKKGEEVTIVALTANAVSSAREMFLAEGFDAFVPKPVETLNLERTLKQVLPPGTIEYRNTEDLVEEVNGGMEAIAVKVDQGKNDKGLTAAGNDRSSDPTSREDSQGDPENSESDSTDTEVLKEAGIQVEKGLEYCMNEMPFYSSILLEYKNGYDEKIKEMNEFYDSRNWLDYTIRVHALKSSSQMIGAQELYEKAKALEAASKAEDLDLINESHPKVISLYTVVYKAICKFLEGETDA
ncbi:MAG: response regulator [Lachnospiraceae bacterium]|nr:response regulator [Lachnospiraceae bacterium]